MTSAKQRFFQTLGKGGEMSPPPLEFAKIWFGFRWAAATLGKVAVIVAEAEVLALGVGVAWDVHTRSSSKRASTALSRRLNRK